MVEGTRDGADGENDAHLVFGDAEVVPALPSAGKLHVLIISGLQLSP